jgi:hypothetical protein
MLQVTRTFLVRSASTARSVIKNLPPNIHTQGRALFSSGSGALKLSYDTVLVSTHENTDSESALSVGLITLNQPKSLNSLADDLFDDLIHASRAFDEMDDIGAIVVTGKGKAFAAGANIPEMSGKDFAAAYNKVRTVGGRCNLTTVASCSLTTNNQLPYTAGIRICFRNGQR